MPDPTTGPTESQAAPPVTHVTHVTHLGPTDPRYPARLLALPSPPLNVTVEGPPDGALHAASTRAVAIVGSRTPHPGAASFARELAGALCRAGVVVVSGGAVGIDAAAHEGALAAGGCTWVVTGTGHGVLYPPEHGPLFQRVALGGGATIWPFEPGTSGHPSRFLRRNGVLVALSDVLVIVQARLRSGTLNAASWARRLGRPCWVVCPAPWELERSEAFAGCHLLRARGALVLTSLDYFMAQLALPPELPGLARPATQPLAATTRNPMETRVLAALGAAPRHVDEVIARCGLPYPEVMTALLTLALEDVLVEGPEGLYRLADPP